MRLLMRRGAPDLLTGAIISVIGSLAVLIAMTLAIEASGYRVNRNTLIIALASFLAVIAGVMWLRSNYSVRHDPRDIPEVQDSDDSGSRVEQILTSGRPWLVGVLTAVLVVATVSVVHHLAPSRIEPAFTSIGFASRGGPQPTGAIDIGAIRVPIILNSSGPVSGEFNLSVDSNLITSKTVSDVQVPTVIELTGYVRAANLCRNEVAVTFVSTSRHRLSINHSIGNELSHRC